MNRAILIVICDFIVSAMLSLATGTPAVDTPFGTHGTALDSRTAAVVLQELRNEQAKLEAERKALAESRFRQGFDTARETRLKEMAKLLAESQIKTEMLERKLALTKESTGALSPEQLQNQLEKEIKNRLQLKIQHQDAVRELEFLRKHSRSVADQYASLKDDFAKRQADLAAAQAIAAQRAEEIARKGEELQTREKHLSAANSALAVRDNELRATRTELDKQGRIARETQQRRQEFESALSFTRGKLSATEKELAESQSRFERAQRTVSNRDLELTEARRRLDNLQKVLKKAVTDLSATRSKAETVSERLMTAERVAAVASGELKTAEAKLADAEEKLRSDVLQRYSDSAMRLKMQLREQRVFIPQTTTLEMFLPLVTINGKNCIVGDFLLLTGNMRERKNFDNVSDLTYACLPLNGKGGTFALKGPLFAPRNESRVGLLEVKNAGDRKPLKTLSLSALKSRGIQDLYLFKANAFGKESCSLEGRCSINFSTGDEYLYVRNNPRGSSQLRAEPGDFILTKQGEFVAVVVDVANPDYGRKQEARCVIFPDNFNWNNVHAVPLEKTSGEKYMTQLAARGNKVFRDIELKERARRK